MPELPAMAAEDEEFARWVGEQPEAITGDPLWRAEAYRIAVFAAACAVADARHLLRACGLRALSDQLLRSVASVAANLAEGYSRSSGPDRVRHYEYALGSAREALVWYVAAAERLAPGRAPAAQARLAAIRRSLLAAIPRERRRTIGAAGRG